MGKAGVRGGKVGPNVTSKGTTPPFRRIKRGNEGQSRARARGSKADGSTVPESYSAPRGGRRGAKRGSKGNDALLVTPEMRQKVRTLAKAYPPAAQSHIAASLGIARNTLYNYFRDDILLGRAELLASVGTQLVQLALQGKDARGADGKPIAPGDIQAMKFVLARLGGWRA